jgi:glycosyltransferase involved in cell wall biosynthesis
VLEYIDRSALRRADLVIVDTQEQLEQLDSTTQEKAVIVPVGATGEWFDAPAPPPAPPLRVCFVGVFTPLHGAPVIGAAVAALADDPGFHFTMVGTGQDHEATRSVASANPHVEWLDWVDGRDLPALVASHHVTLGIFGTTPKALRVVPTKVYQGLAAGNEVITSDTAPQRRALGDAAHYVAPGDAEALVVALREVAADSVVGGPQVVAERQARRERFRAAEVVAPLLDAEWRREPG